MFAKISCSNCKSSMNLLSPWLSYREKSMEQKPKKKKPYSKWKLKNLPYVPSAENVQFQDIVSAMRKYSWQTDEVLLLLKKSQLKVVWLWERSLTMLEKVGWEGCWNKLGPVIKPGKILTGREKEIKGQHVVSIIV